MSIRQMVLDAVKGRPGAQLTAADVLAEIEREHAGEGLDVSREQVSNSLSDLAAWSEITRVSRGVYAYEFKAEDTPKLTKLLKEGSQAFAADHEVSTQVGDGKYFTQVGTAQNGDLVLTRDSDGVAYRATPL